MSPTDLADPQHLDFELGTIASHRAFAHLRVS